MLIYWQSKIGLEKEVEASLQRLRGENADISTEAAEIKVTKWSKMCNLAVLFTCLSLSHFSVEV